MATVEKPYKHAINTRKPLGFIFAFTRFFFKQYWYIDNMQ